MIDVLEKPIDIKTEPVTDPRIDIPTLCGVKDCGRLASPGLCCHDCGMALCQRHTFPWFTADSNQIFCPGHRKGL